jgi:solute carrier family 25 carnitine/acylcarnitine transporter 20/29
MGRDGFKGLYKGNISTLLREIPGYATQFGAYEYLKQFYISPNHQHLTLAETLIVCPAAAMIGWIFSYPQDVIKTKIQV